MPDILEFLVTDSDTAVALGSGDVEVLATPRLIAWIEAATVLTAAPELAQGQTSVGTWVEVNHLRATPVGATVRVRAEIVGRMGRELVFDVHADHLIRGTASAIARGQIRRAVVDRQRFEERVPHL